METCHHWWFAASGYDAVAYIVVAARKPPPMATLPLGQTTVPFTMLPEPTLVDVGGLTISTPERPAGPIGPAAPCGPVGPVGPSDPSAPLQLEVRRRGRRANAERKTGMRRYNTVFNGRRWVQRRDLRHQTLNERAAERQVRRGSGRRTSDGWKPPRFARDDGSRRRLVHGAQYLEFKTR